VFDCLSSAFVLCFSMCEVCPISKEVKISASSLPQNSMLAVDFDMESSQCCFEDRRSRSHVATEKTRKGASARKAQPKFETNKHASREDVKSNQINKVKTLPQQNKPYEAYPKVNKTRKTNETKQAKNNPTALPLPHPCSFHCPSLFPFPFLSLSLSPLSLFLLV